MEHFYTDKQTLADLQLLDDGPDGVFACFNKTITYGGEDALRELFRKPSNDLNQLQQRSATIRFLMDHVEELRLDKTTLDFLDYYLKSPERPVSFSVYRGIRNAIKFIFSPTQAFYAKRRGIAEMADTLVFIKQLGENYPEGNKIPLLADLQDSLQKLTQHPLLAKLVDAPDHRLKRYTIEQIDFLLRKKYHQETLTLLDQVYFLDAYYAVASASRTHGFMFPSFQEQERLTLKGVYHPMVSRPVANYVILDAERRVNFITGANMSGKSTLMKAVGIAVYLAHLGFPVPASHMDTCVLDGLITTINLADNVNDGYSHFYSEVKRVKLVAQQINQSDRLMVIFDELFRGTNVKDAYDGSLRIIQALSGLDKGFFMISTHIVEVAHALSANGKISFGYLPTRMEEDKPVFDYQLRKGITDDRIGLWILQNEGVFELLAAKKLES
ncbi:MutS-related protein [Parapedobacter indicus]|uniref:MutS domain V n=1 Tax=Parapedobacter indicus TaxID=1477437 RepID=A0A1I3KGC4_9SPHI|nr:hypothetical protein [Parapedobacter indicus]PPL01814.1 MutS-like protein [Parapedobacter indicus]SFI71503.1 MutS domain V [Parapedobacter indicus]